MSPRDTSDDRRRSNHRRAVIAGLAALVAAFVGVEVYIQRAPASPAPVSSTVLLHAITVVNILLLLTLLFVLGRNLIKLYVERRREELGSKFRTKLVVTYIGLALIPSIFLFFVASDLIQKSIDRWFSTAVEEVNVRARDLVRQTLRLEEDRLLESARGIARQITDGRMLTADSWQFLRNRMSERVDRLHLDAIYVFAGDRLLIDPVVADGSPLAGRLPAAPARRDTAPETSPASSAPDALVGRDAGTLTVPDAEITLALHGQPFRLHDDLPDGRKVVRAGVPIYAPNGRDVAGLVVLARVLDTQVAAQADAIETLYLNYMQGVDQKEPIKTAYLLTFLLMTLLILFSMVWVGLYLARGVTVPIQKLAEGTREVAAGNLDYQVEVEARDELGILVDSFNRMTRDLSASQDKLEQSRDHLERTIGELEERRSYMESVLANIATGVVSMNAEGRITTFNRAARKMLGLDDDDALGRPYQQVLGESNFDELRRMMERARDRRSALEEEVIVDAAGRRLTMAAHCSSLRDSSGAYLGTVMVLDDLTELIKGQKAAAWREVARRIAHEIRNPLTPIQLSAQRILRRYRRAAGAEQEYTVIEEGTRTILQEVDTLKGLVEEFSRFARMPSAQPEPTDLNEVIDSSLVPYGMRDGIVVERDLEEDLPRLEVDPDQIRRAFTNLFDNAVEAMDGDGRLRVSTRFDPSLEVVRIEVADTGPGIPPEDKDRLFMPYFSRKRDGTGLGLAIVHQIVTDHRGYVRVADNLPRGSVFVIELPR